MDEAIDRLQQAPVTSHAQRHAMGAAVMILARQRAIKAAKRGQPYLAPGERATIMVIATDRRQARVIFRYIRALLTMVPMLALC